MDVKTKIEAYFNNELNVSEKNNFFKEVESNSELKSEFNFQNEVINGIKEVRKAELKALLNNVTITSVGTATTGLYKIMAGGAVALILGTSFWYYFNTQSVLENADGNNMAETTPKNEYKTNSATETVALKDDNESATLTDESKELIATKATKKYKPTINIPVVPNSENGFATQPLQEENLDIPNDIGNTSINLSTKVEVEIKLKKKYSFHYQYLQGKLVLYGNFEEGLIEVLELNKESSTEIYLYCKSHYYHISDKSGEITPLEEVKDSSLEKNLEQIRSNF